MQQQELIRVRRKTNLEQVEMNKFLAIAPHQLKLSTPHDDGNVEMEAQNDDSRDIHWTARHGHDTEQGNLNTSKATYVFFIFL